MKRERRTLRLPQVRAEGGGRRFEAVVLVYNVIDDYNTRFRPGVFTDSLADRLPRITWGHDWRDPLGRWVDYRDTDTELTLIGEFDDFDAVPRARQASAQLVSGTIDQFSVGFTRLADELVDPDEVDGARGVMDITKGTLDECALVLVGAVPGTHLVSMRSGGAVDLDAVVEIAKRKAAGELSDDEAKVALDLLAAPEGDEGEGGSTETPPPEGTETTPPVDEPPPPAALDPLDAEAAELADRLDRSR